MTSRDLYNLLHLLAKLEEEVGRFDEPTHLAVLICKIQVERQLTQRKEPG